MGHKAGFVNIVGNPNVGKSTLMNALVGEQLSIITAKAQTTRHRILGIVNDEDHQILFSDTPGMLQPAYPLQESMMNFVNAAFQDADILVCMLDVGEKKLNATLLKRMLNSTIPILLVINKIDLSSQEEVKEKVAHWQATVPNSIVFVISALENFNVLGLFDKIVELLPENPAFYPKDQLTDKPERFFVNEYIREKILTHYQKEIPYAVEVEAESFLEEEKMIKIRSVIMVERASQKGILIGHRGAAIKRVGVEARKQLESFFEKKIYLQLYVKVNKNWRSNERELKRFGYQQK